MAFMKSLFVGTLLLSFWTLHTSQLSVVRSVDDLTASLKAFMFKDYPNSLEKINNFVQRARAHAKEAMRLELISKQLKPILKAIENAKKNGIKEDCDLMYDEMEIEPSMIEKQAAESLRDCDGIEDEISYLVDDVNKVLRKVESCIEEARNILLDCTIEQSNTRADLQRCLDPVFKESQKKMNQLMEREMRRLDESFDDTEDGINEYMFKCLVNARGEVLRKSRTAANRINSCVMNNQIPILIPQKKMPWEGTNEAAEMWTHVQQMITREKARSEDYWDSD